jgi:outer membrane protein
MTSKIVSTLSIAVLLTAAAFAQAADTNAAAATSTTNSVIAGPTKLAIINIQAAIANTNEGQRDLDALQKKFEPKQIELKSLNDEVDNLKKQLAAQTDKLNDDERNKRVQAIEAKQKTLQRNLEDAQNDYQAQSNEIAQRIGTKLMQSLDAYAKQNGYAVVIDVSSQQSPVLWAAQSVDITKPVIDAYNVVSGVPAQAAPKAPAATGSNSVTAPRRSATPASTTPAAPRPAAPSSTTPK